MEAWAAGVVERLAELEAEVEPVVTAGADGVQASFVAVRHGAKSESPVRLVLGLDAEGVRAGLELPAAQARAARTRLADAARALELATALEALPEQFTTGESADASAGEAPRATADDIRALLDRVERERGTLWIGWRIPRALFVEHAAAVDDLLADAVVALARVFLLLGGDAADAQGRADAPRGPRQRFAGKRAKDGDDDRSGAAAHAHEKPRGRGNRPRVRARDREQEEGETPEASELEPAREVAGPGRPFGAKQPARLGRRRPAKLSTPVERGARVRVLGGPFSGKVGVVQELDGKGGARVMLGLLAVRLEVDNLMAEAEGRGRPLLSSSHRKPIPARS